MGRKTLTGGDERFRSFAELREKGFVPAQASRLRLKRSDGRACRYVKRRFLSRSQGSLSVLPFLRQFICGRRERRKFFLYGRELAAGSLCFFLCRVRSRRSRDPTGKRRSECRQFVREFGVGGVFGLKRRQPRFLRFVGGKGRTIFKKIRRGLTHLGVRRLTFLGAAVEFVFEFRRPFVEIFDFGKQCNQVFKGLLCRVSEGCLLR